MAAKAVHVRSKARSVILPDMDGGPGQVDTSDYKPFIVIADEIAKSVGRVPAGTSGGLSQRFPEQRIDQGSNFQGQPKEWSVRGGLH